MKIKFCHVDATKSSYSVKNANECLEFFIINVRPKMNPILISSHKWCLLGYYFLVTTRMVIVLKTSLKVVFIHIKNKTHRVRYTIYIFKSQMKFMIGYG